MDSLNFGAIYVCCPVHHGKKRKLTCNGKEERISCLLLAIKDFGNSSNNETSFLFYRFLFCYISWLWKFMFARHADCKNHLYISKFYLAVIAVYLYYDEKVLKSPALQSSPFSKTVDHFIVREPTTHIQWSGQICMVDVSIAQTQNPFIDTN